MKTKSFLNKFSSKGFTLIELLIVIAILGILAAAVLVAINPGQRIASARNSRVRADLANMGNAANIFNTDTGLITSCVTGGSYPSGFGTTACTVAYMAAPAAPSSSYTYIGWTSGGAVCNNASVATACARVAIHGPAYSDGNVDATTNNRWCWKSSTGTITQTTSAACTP
ncbi:MAG: type II secretion system protein [Candidatus Levybacteria bacterium]|nr:type II secretion system protein [Candidatus Levybacteria bacterium]